MLAQRLRFADRTVFNRPQAVLIQAVATAVGHGDREDCSSSSLMQKHGYRFGLGSSERQCPGCPALEAMADTVTDKAPRNTSIRHWLAPLQFKASSFWRWVPRGGRHLARLEPVIPKCIVD